MTHGTNAEIRLDSRPVPHPEAGASRAGSWLSLRQAAGMIGVHSTTLRRWSDEGRLPSFRTAGGHRRFLRGDVEAFVTAHSRLRALGGLGDCWARQVRSSLWRRKPFNIAGQPFTATDRAAFRATGQRLLALTLAATDDERSAEQMQSEAGRIGKTYADWARRRGVPLDGMLIVLSQVRSTLVETALDISDSEVVQVQAVGGILRQIHRLQDAVEFALVRASLTPPWTRAGQD